MQTYKYYLRTRGYMRYEETIDYRLRFQRLLRQSIEDSHFYLMTEEERPRYRNMLDRVEYYTYLDDCLDISNIRGVTVYLKMELPENYYDWLEHQIGQSLRQAIKDLRPEDVRCGQIDMHGLFADGHLEFKGVERENDDSFEKAVNSISDAGMAR